MNFIDSGVTFKDILNAGFITGGPKIAKGKYKKDANNNITGNMPVVNAIDIDWNKAEVPGLNDPITSTGQLLALIGQLKQVLDNTGTSTNQTVLERLTVLESNVEELNNRIDEYHLDYSFEYDLLNVVKSSGPASMKKTDTVNIVFSASAGYILPNDIIVNDATYSYNKNNGIVTISNPTKKNISIIIHTDELRQCSFTTPTLDKLDFTIVTGAKSHYVINDTLIGQLSLKSTADQELYGLPASVNGTNCTISDYNSITGEFKIKCTGTGNMTISASVRDIANYYFAVALETNPIFTRTNNTITNCNLNSITSIPSYMSAIGSCPINFVTGFDVDSSIDVEGAYVWFIIPSKYFNKSNFNFINGNNKYLLKQSNIQDLTVNTKIKECVDVAGKIPYTLVCVSNNGLIGKQEFKKI